MCVKSHESGSVSTVRADPTALLSAHLDRLYAFFHRRIRHHDDAEDLVSDTITLVLAKWSKYDSSRPFWPWLVTVARRQLATAARSGKLKYHSPLAENTGAADTASATTTPPALDILVSNEDHDRLRAAIDALPLNQRENVLLYYFDELSAKEIADMESVPLGTIYRRLSEARGHLVAVLPDLIPSSR